MWQEESEVFSLGRLDGILRTRRPLDREQEAEFHLVVLARDRGSPPLSAQQLLTVTVTDTNDNTPVFSPKTYR